MKFEIAKRQK